MIKKLILSITFLISLIPTIFPNIVEHDSFESILNYLNDDDNHRYTLIILDIDNTLAQTIKLIGSDQWVAHEMKKRIDEGLTPREAWLAIKDLYVAIQHAIDLIAVEEITPAIIKELQTRGIIVIAVTARLPEIADRTIEQLKQIGIDLTHAPLWHEELLSNSDLIYHYKNGIIFCDGNDKGHVLEAILQRIGHEPKKVIAVDDREKNLHAIKKIFESHIDFIGIRYSKLDKKIAAFDASQAEQELQLLIA